MLLLLLLWTDFSSTQKTSSTVVVMAKLADRSRVVKQRQKQGRIARYHDNGRSIEGPSYRSSKRAADSESLADAAQRRLEADARERARKQLELERQQQPQNLKAAATGGNNNNKKTAPWKLPLDQEEPPPKVVVQQPNNSPDFMKIQTSTATTLHHHNPLHIDTQEMDEEQQQQRHLSSQLSGCCYNYKSYSADSMCALYGQDCEEARSNSHDSGDEDCTQTGLSFIGLSFSVNTASGNPYSYQLCDQFPMENIIDRDYEYVMSMDEDGWLVGGGYKTFDYSGKMP
jgi:hypothetical protein